MSTELKKEDTENIIKETAKKLFFGEGKFNATTQEIADAAGVNRSLINYYFRSRDNLFALIFEEAQIREIEKSKVILQSKLTFKEKIAQYIEDCLKSSMEYPYLENYLVTQINQGCVYDSDHVEEIMVIFSTELNEEIIKGRIDPVTPNQFVLNLLSLVSFPTSMRPLFQKSLKISDEEYVEILSQRKDIILKLLFKN